MKEEKKSVLRSWKLLQNDLILTMKDYITSESVNQAKRGKEASVDTDVTMFPKLNSILHNQIEPKRKQAAIMAALFREIADDMLSGDISPYMDVITANLGEYEDLEPLWRKYSKSYRKRSDKMESCGSYLEFGYHAAEDIFRLQKANFCKARLCPMCVQRRSLKLFSQLSRIVDAVSDAGYQYVFMTLTMKNVEAPDLSEAISRMLRAFNRMMDRKSLPGHSGVRGELNPVARMSRGYFRSLEVTASAEHGYHPHLHVLVAVDPDYFTGSEYIDQKTLGETWRRFLGVGYNPVVDIRKPKIYGHTERNSVDVVRKAVLEICKYTVKSSDIVGYGDESREEVKRRLFALDTALYGRRLVGMSGVFRKFHKDLNLSDVDDIQEIDIENPTVADLIIRLQWRGFGWHTEYEILADEEQITE